MSKSDTSAQAAAPKSAAGFVAQIFTKAFGAMTPAERKSVLADAMVSTSITSLTAKAHDIMDGKNVDIEQIEDLWDVGPDGMPPSEKVSGVSGDHEGGKIITGPSQSATGGDTEKMAREYSRPAKQGGAQLATEKLGELLSAKAIRALTKAIGEQSRQIDLLGSAVSVLVGEMAAVKSLSAKALRKAESEKDSESGSEDEEADEEASESESGSGTEIEITNEMDEEDEADDEEAKAKAMSAAKARVAAKARLRLAKGRVAKANDAVFEGQVKQAARHFGVAKAHVAKARNYFATAKAVRPQAANKLALLEKALRAAAKAIPADTDNQDKWPATDGKTAKAVDTQAVAPDVAATVKALEAKFQESVKGLQMQQATIADLMRSVAGQSRNGTGLPPALDILAKSAGTEGAAAIVKARQQVEAAAEAGTLTQRDVDTASDVLGLIEGLRQGMAIDPAIIKARINVMTPVMKAIFQEAA